MTPLELARDILDGKPHIASCQTLLARALIAKHSTCRPAFSAVCDRGCLACGSLRTATRIGSVPSTATVLRLARGSARPGLTRTKLPRDYGPWEFGVACNYVLRATSWRWQWGLETQEWQEAAERWRDAYHAAIDAARGEGK